MNLCRLLTDTYPKCEESDYECFVLDRAGFLIMHKDFLSPDITAKKLEYIHITAKEKEIAEDLIQKGHLVKKRCKNLEKINTENFYELSVSFQGVNTLTTGQRCRQYQISAVTGSNAFLGENFSGCIINVFLHNNNIKNINQLTIADHQTSVRKVTWVQTHLELRKLFSFSHAHHSACISLLT